MSRMIAIVQELGDSLPRSREVIYFEANGFNDAKEKLRLELKRKTPGKTYMVDIALCVGYSIQIST